jgi:glycosyltransferase involved in cell wall biosynthesis
MICFFNTTKAWGGGEKWHFDIASRLSKDGEKVMVVAHKHSELRKKLRQHGIEPFAFKISNLSFLNPVRLLRLCSFFRHHQVKTLVINLPADLKIAGLAARVAGVKRIIYRRGSAIPIKNSMINRFLFGKIITDVLVNSKETKHTILANNPRLISGEKIKVIYNGIEAENFHPESLSDNSEKQDNKPIVIGNLGRLEKQKAQHLLIELGTKLQKAGNNFRIMIGGDGRLREELLQKIHFAGLSKNIQLAGHIEDVGAFMQSIDIFVLTSHWEGFGYVLAEAMACEKPVIAFNHSSNPELIDHNKTGLLVKPGDIDDLFEKTVILINDNNLRTAFGKAGRQKALHEFNFETNYLKIKRFLLEK